MAQVILSRRARRDILDLDWPLTDAIEQALGLLERDPQAGHELRGRLRWLWSLRVGSYRVIYQLVEGDHIVRVLTVRHRSAAYLADPR